jgi:putative phosphoesterase
VRIGLISDTHVPTTMEYPPEQILKAFDSVDLILHAGNIHVTLVLDWLEQVAPVKASGSTDSDHPERHQSFSMECAEDSRVAPLQILELEGYRIGVANNLLLHGMNDEIRPGEIGRHLERRPSMSFRAMIYDFFGVALDIVVFGRTTFAMVEEHQGMLFVNPGSPALPRNLRKLGSVAVLELSEDGASASIIELSDLVV